MLGLVAVAPLAFLGPASVTHPAARLSHRIAGAVADDARQVLPLLKLRGGAKSAAVQEPDAKPKSGTPMMRLYAVCATIVLAWIALATAVFAFNENWPLAQSLFYAVDTGMSIGFGAVAEERLSTKVFTICHVLLGASAVGGAIALFAESAVEGSHQIAATEYAQSALQAAFERADSDRSGVLSAEEFANVLTKAGLQLSPAELAQARAVFDPDADGAITVDEFMRAVGPFVSSERPVDESIRLAMARRSAPPALRVLLAAADVVSAQRTLLLWAAWIAAGAVWGVLTEKWDPITAVYFAVGGLATGGLQAPSLTAAGTLKPGSATFVALWCLTGIPIFAMALGGFASVFVNRFVAAKERRAINRTISAEEFDFATRLFKDDGKLDLSEFIALELLRLGKVEMETLEIIRREFNSLDRDRNGLLTKKEVLALKGSTPAEDKKKGA